MPTSRSSKKPSAARARGLARRCGMRRPVTSVSESTATEAPGTMNPLVMGATTTAAPGVPGATSRTGAWTPWVAKVAASRAAPEAVEAHSDDREPLADEPRHARGQPCRISCHRVEPLHPERRDRRPFGDGRHRRDRSRAVAQQALEGDVQAREDLLGALLGPPRGGQRLGQCCLLVEELRAPVPDAPRLDEEHLPGRRQQVRQDAARSAPRRAATTPCRRTGRPRARRSHTDAPHGGAPPALGRRTAALGEDELTAAVDGDRVEVPRRALVADGERGEAVDLVAPQVDADRLVRRRGEHVDDAAAHRELPAVLDLVLAPVPARHQLGQRAHRARAGRPARTTTGAVSPSGPSRWSRARTGATITRGGGIRPPTPSVSASEDGEAPAHRLDLRADTLEGQRLPRRQHHHRTVERPDDAAADAAVPGSSGRPRRSPMVQRGRRGRRRCAPHRAPLR